MKLAVVLLLVFGIVAAGAATVFVQSLSFFKDKEVKTVDVLVAIEDLPARSPLTEASVEVRKMPPTGLPGDYLANWGQAAGKTLKMAVVAGQPLSDSYFMPKNSIDELLRPGMLAFAAPMSARNTNVNLLYPGCIVDVFATFPLSNREKGDAVTTPLLQKIQVLAVAEHTVIPAEDSRAKAEQQATRRSSGGNVTVTLEVTARQAAALQLAMEKGTLGLAMRSPSDDGWNPMEPMVVKEGQLVASSEALDPQTLAWVTSIQRMLNPQLAPDPNSVQAVAAAQPIPAAVAQATDPNELMLNVLRPQPEPQEVPLAMQSRKSTTSVTVIKGAKTEEVEIANKESQEKTSDEEAPSEEAGG